MTTLLDTPLSFDFCRAGRQTIQLEIEAIQSIAQRLDQHFNRACQLLISSKGKIIVMGMGKSGHIANKIAATLASTGSPAFFVHPAEARHGDLGMISAQDTLLILSNSGETAEIITLLPSFKQLGNTLIAVTGNPQSTLAQAATVNLDASVAREACPLNLAPTSSTTVALVIGDAIATALLQAKGFTSEAFASSHPGGNLGRRLLLRVDALMRTGTAIPRVLPHTKLREALLEITHKRLGMTAVTSEEGKVQGIFTDGDLRRAFDKNVDIHQTPLSELMTPHCKTVLPGLLAAEALHIMETFKITTLLVTDNDQYLLGILHIHDLLEKGMT
ncbi:MAG: KpsF/GutQ family sugar-phosphate isomerase [Gammaproteobacteria bacterium]|nr:KpsF/GutQ family sugar-phosphate isomerase [Gammaproteobacteria bacterium]